MRIGPYALASPVVLAPMAGVTDQPFRQLCREFGVGLALGEMVTAEQRLWQTAKSRQRLRWEAEPAPRCVQVLGGEPQALAQAAQACVARGAQLIDINMGCPVKKVCRQAAGAALLRDEARAAAILEAVVQQVAVPVTLKIRSGWDAANRNAVRLARLAEAAGVQAISVHARTAVGGYSEPPDYAVIAAVKQAVTLPVIANGSIASPVQAAQVLAATGADAVMIGRAALGQPWLLGEIGAYVSRAERLPPLPLATRAGWIERHLQAIYRFYGESLGVRVARKHIDAYLRALAVSAEQRRPLLRAVTAAQQQRMLADFFEQQVGSQELAA